MTVHIVTDTASGLPHELIQELGITVLDLHVMAAESGSGEATTTAGLSALELAAAFGRAVERSAGDGVVAIFLSTTLSSTWAAATTAASVFEEGMVHVLDSGTAGMVGGAAAMAAARLAGEGASAAECAAIAEDTLRRGQTWVYLSSMEYLRRSGRMNAATTMSTALFATKPILAVESGKLEVVGKTRTQTKAFAKLVELASLRAAGKPAFVALQHHQAEAGAQELEHLLDQALPAGSSIMVTELNEVLAVHTGPGAIGISCVFSSP